MSTNFNDLAIGIINQDINFNGDVFIIPNSANLIKHFMAKHVQEEITERMDHLCKLNNTTFDPENDYILQVCYVIPDLESKDLVHHGIRWNDPENGRHFLRTFTYGSFIPAKFFDGCKEGDTKLIKFPMTHTYRKKDIKQERDCIANISMQCSQKKYQYSNFGNWEDALETVIAAGKRE